MQRPAGLPGRVGRPLPDARVDADANGCLQIGGPTLMSGYANAEGRVGLGLDAEGRFPSSDLGRLDADGRLWVEGRADEVLVSGGVNVQPAQVETALADLAELGQVAVTGLPDPVWGQRLVLCYTGPASPDRALALCRERLAGAARPRLALHLPRLPLRGPGKLDRRRLAALAAERLGP